MLSSPVVFIHRGRDLAGVVHGDDFVFVGLDQDLDYVLGVLKAHYDLKDRGRLGSGPEDKREIDMLGRTIRWHEWGMTWEGDDRHKKSVMEYFGLDDGSATLTKNGYKDEGAEDSSAGQNLSHDEKRAYRMLAAKLNYMAQDNPAI